MAKKSAKQKEIDPVWMERYGHEPTFEEIFAYFGQPVPKPEPPLDPKYMPEFSCRFFNQKAKTGCEALKDQYCRYGKCSFYKEAT